MKRYVLQRLKASYWRIRGIANMCWHAYKPIIDLAQHPRDTILVAGSARSGTTWIGSVCAEIIGARPIFEPFILSINKNFVLFEKRLFDRTLRKKALMSYSHYFPNKDGNCYSSLVPQLEMIFQGKLRSCWTDSDTRFLRIYKKRLIKAIRANLFLSFVAKRWPEMRIIWVIRDPIQVIRSQIVANWYMKWDFDLDLVNLLSQKDLIEDWLNPYINSIKNAKTITEKLAHRWCIENLVPYKQGVHNYENVLLVFYESLIKKKEDWLRIFNFLGVKNIDLNNHLFERRSKTYIKISDIDKKKALGEAGFSSDIIMSIVRSYGLIELINLGKK